MRWCILLERTAARHGKYRSLRGSNGQASSATALDLAELRMKSLGNYLSTDVPVLPEESPAGTPGLAVTLSKNVAFSLARVMANGLIALVLPAYLTHHMSVDTYGAWVLILQLGAFVSFLDLGIQTAVSKFVAEHDAKGDEVEAGRYASAGFAIMTLTGFLGVLLTLGLAWQVPRLFHKMPAALYGDVRLSVMLVGISLSFALVCSVFSAIFMGLQRYAVPMGIAILNRFSFAGAVLAAVFLHGSLAAMGTAVAVVNVATSLLQFVAWKKLIARVRLSVSMVNAPVLRQMARYCFLLAVWTVGMVCVSGLDVTLVGHYAYGETAYYSIAVLPTNFMLVIMAAMLGPVIPASSALSTQRSPVEMGHLLARASRYSTMFLLLTGLPLVVYGLPILRIWVGPVYAEKSFRYLQILVLANIVRNLCTPYATMVAATGKLREATASPVLEAVVNLTCSILLARRFGAIGVAFGTMIGSFVSVTLHYLVSMKLTRNTLTIPRTKLLLTGLLRPAMIVLPCLLFVPLWRYSPKAESLGPWTIVWGASTLLIAWFGVLGQQERGDLVRVARRVARM